jgi:hypothetical protein
MKKRRFQVAGVLALMIALTFLAALILARAQNRIDEPKSQNKTTYPEIQVINPPEDGFYTKLLSYRGVLIKAPSVVVDDALYATYDRLAMETAHLPMVVTNLGAAGAELHIIGRDQVTTDLPEWRQDKHVPLDEYNGLTRDQRTRGMGGLITSCGEENLLKLSVDRYRGRDICLHEFAHNIEGHGIQPEVRAMFDAQYQASKSKGLWLNSYAGSNPSEYFAELTMWYFGTHGDLNMTGPKPENGPEGLKAYDPDAYKLFDDFYSGRIEIKKVEPRFPPGTVSGFRRTPRDSQLARAIVAHLSVYKISETKLADFFADAGMTGPKDAGADGWHVVRQGAGETKGDPAGSNGQFRVFFRRPEGEGVAANAPQTNARPVVDRLIADLEFKDGVLITFLWRN